MVIVPRSGLMLYAVLLPSAGVVSLSVHALIAIFLQLWMLAHMQLTGYDIRKLEVLEAPFAIVVEIYPAYSKR